MRAPADGAQHPMDGADPVLVFDVGLVLVDADYQPFLDYMRAHGAAAATDMESFCAAVDLDAHERGELGAESFLDRLARTAARPMRRDELLSHWNGMYRPVAPMIDCVRRARLRYRVHLLSNMGELHWRHLEAAFGIPSLGHGAVASYAVGALKPDPGIYERLESQVGLAPGRLLFIDDRPVNVDAARARGWRGIVHRAPAETLRALAEAGVELPT